MSNMNIPHPSVPGGLYQGIGITDILFNCWETPTVHFMEMSTYLLVTFNIRREL